MALNTPYKRINPNSINYAAMGQKDPWFALGYALGEGYWNNYNARGEAKATETTKQGLDNFLKYGNIDGPVLGDDEMLSKYARPDKKQQAIDAAVQLPELKSLSKGKDGESKGVATTSQPTFDHALLKWGYTQDKYKDSPNPVGDSIAAQKLLNGTEIALNSTNMGAFNEDAFKLAIMDKLTKEGRTPQQREAAWAAIQPMIAGKKQEYNQQQANKLFEAARAAFENGDYALGESYSLQLSKYDKDTAKYLLNKENTRYNNDLNFNRQLAIANARRGGEKVSDIFSSEKYQQAVKQNEYYNKVLASGRALTEAEQRDYYNVQRWLHAANSQGYGLQGKPWVPDLNNKDDLIEVVKANQDAGKSNAEILDWAKKQVEGKAMSQEMYDGLSKQLSPPKKVRPEPKKEEKSQVEQLVEHGKKIAEFRKENPNSWYAPWGEFYKNEPWFTNPHREGPLLAGKK